MDPKSLGRPDFYKRIYTNKFCGRLRLQSPYTDDIGPPIVIS